MKQELKKPLLLITFGVVLYAMLMNFNVTLALLQKLLGLVLPVVLGLGIAFVLSVPMNGILRFLKKWNKGVEKKWMAPASLLLTLVAIALVLVVVVTAAIPALAESITSVAALVEQRWPEWLALVEQRWPEWAQELQGLPAWLESLNWEQLLRQVTSGAGSLLSSAVDVAGATISGFTATVFALVIAVYVLLDKARLGEQAKKLCYAWLKRERAERLIHVAALTRKTFSKFLSGQCTEAIILGLLIFITFKLLALPYAGLIAMLTGVCAFVPYVGALVSCLLGTFLILLVDPLRALLCLCAYLVVQFVENQFIYPHVVGGSVGLSPLWTLIAALVGGKLFGLFGMVFFVPLTAVVYTLVREATLKRLEQTE